MAEPGDVPRTGSPAQPDAAAAREQRHSRLEALAKELTAGVGGAASGSRSISVPVLASAAAVVVLALGWLLWPAFDTPKERAGQQADETVAQLQARLAERARRRKAQERSGGDYLARSAAADSAVLADMTARAERIAAALDAPRARAPQPKPAASVAKAAPAPAQTATAEPAPAPAPAPKSETKAEPAQAAAASAPPAQVATAAPPQAASAAPAPEEDCRIRVSELSSSGKLTYDDIAHMKGAHVDEKTRHAFTPPVQVKGRSVVFDVSPSGCVTVARSFGR